MVTKELTNDFSKSLNGLNLAADVVKSTMGGRGKTVVISDSDAKNLRFTKDGVSVAKKIALEDPLENIGVKMLVAACEKTVEEVGDGTTATAVLLQALVNNSLKNIHSATDINKVFEQMDSELAYIIGKLRESSKNVKSIEQVRDIATISSNSSRIGELFYEIYSDTGLDTLIKLERSEECTESYYDVMRGLEFNTGYAHSSFMTDKHTEQAIYEYPYLHISKSPINNLDEGLQAMLSAAQMEGTPVVIIAPRFSDAVIRALSMNKVNNGLQVVAIKTPGFGNAQAKNIDDINAFLTDQGFAEKIIVGPNYFTLYNHDTPFLEDRIKQLTALKEHALDSYEQQDIIERIYKLKGSSVILYAGGITSEALNEEYDRLEDAIGAVNAAIDYGYVQGAGMALYSLHEKEKNSIINSSILEPAYQILRNANLIPEVILANLRSNTDVYDVKNNYFVDYETGGIIDPTEVVVQALTNAVSMAKLFINSSYILHNHFENKSPFKI